MAEPPKRRKLYLEPFFDGAGLPKTTEYRSDCAERSHAHRIRDDCGVLTASANDPSAPGNCLLNNSAPEDRLAVHEVGDYKQSGSLAADEQDDCEVSGSPVMNEQDDSEECDKRVVDQEESSGTFPPDSNFSVEDLVTLVMDFAVTSGLPWTQLEKLMKFVCFLLKRNDLPDTKFLFRKFTGISLESLTFHFYCPNCMFLLAECEGNLKKRQKVQMTCGKCNENLRSIPQKLLQEMAIFL